MCPTLSVVRPFPSLHLSKDECRVWIIRCLSPCFLFLCFRRRTGRSVAKGGGAWRTVWQFIGGQLRSGITHLFLIYFCRLHLWNDIYALVWMDWQEEDNMGFLSTLTRTQAAAVERRVKSAYQTQRRRNRQHVPDVRDIFRSAEMVRSRCTQMNLWTGIPCLFLMHTCSLQPGECRFHQHKSPSFNAKYTGSAFIINLWVGNDLLLQRCTKSD